MAVCLPVAIAGKLNPSMTRHDERIAWFGDRFQDARWSWRMTQHGRHLIGIDAPLAILTDRRNARGQGAPRNRASRSVSSRSPDSSSLEDDSCRQSERAKGGAR